MTDTRRAITTFPSSADENLHRSTFVGGPQKPSQLAAAVKAKASSHNNIQTFLANRLAKIVTGVSRANYRIKDEAINALVRHGAASLDSLENLPHGPTIGLAFVDGGLHILPSHLDSLARRLLHQQFAAALCGRGLADTHCNVAVELSYEVAQGVRQ